MARFIARICVMGLLCGLNVNSFAQAGWYLEGGLGQGRVKTVEISRGSVPHITGIIGFRFNPFSALEFDFTGFEDNALTKTTTVTNPGPNVITTKSKWKGDVYAFMFKYFHPVSAQVELSGKLGLGWDNEKVRTKTSLNGTLTSDVTDTDTGLIALIAIGAQIAVTEKFSLGVTATATSPNDDIKSKYIWMLSGTYTV